MAMGQEQMRGSARVEARGTCVFLGRIPWLSPHRGRLAGR
jgi:hypothetical protein